MPFAVSTRKSYSGEFRSLAALFLTGMNWFRILGVDVRRCLATIKVESNDAAIEFWSRLILEVSRFQSH